MNKFLEQAYVKLEENSRRLLLITNKPLNPNLRPTKSPLEESFRSSFLEISIPRARIDPFSYDDQLEGNACVILDDDTAKDGLSCQIIAKNRGVGYRYDVRSDFFSAQVALEAILEGSTNVQRLRNKAAMTGGILRNFNRDNTAFVNVDAVAFRNRPETAPHWTKCLRRQPMCIPVFCTAEIPLEVRLVLSSLLRP